MNLPEDLKYTADHEWIKLESDNIAIVGITDFAQGELGDIVYVDVDTVGEALGQDEVFGSIEAVKTVSDLFLPVAGEVIELNESIEDDPASVNEDPYGKGWIVKVKVDNPQDIDGLMSAQDYKKSIS